MMKLLSTLALLLLVQVTFGKPPGRDPERNFEAFWQIFHRQYAHFETRNVDWQQQYNRFRSRVTAGTSDEQLLTIFNEMVAPLKDGHVVISPTGDLPASAKYARFHNEFPTKDLQKQFHQVTLSVLQANGFGPFVRFDSAPYDIGGYTRSTDYGYLLVNGFGGMPLDRFSAQLDQMIDSFADVKAVIIDIRINGGGDPGFLSALTGRLTDVKRLIGYGRTRTGRQPHEFSRWSTYYLSPQATRRLVKPTVLLTSGASISAADHCAMVLKQLPYVRLVGENTNGMFSSMLGKRLPNGWALSLSHQQYVDAKRRSYEGVGVPVDVEVRHHRSDLQRGHDPALERAFEVLRIETPALAQQTVCPEQIALNYFADSLLPGKVYGDMAGYSTGLVEEDATLLSPFAARCASLQVSNGPNGLMSRITTEQNPDSTFYRANVQNRLYVECPKSLRPKRLWILGRRKSRLTVSHHIAIGDKYYVRLNLHEGAWKGKTVLIVLNTNGQVIEHCALNYDYASGQGYL
ncbi:hypothetical protein DYU11_24355 [Fibrisoma montanum]|uniref:Tail specific protease domain-containing protein n=1 Tax=Fibrisoma montanum TaxID=2305895 RepID=A0A418M2Z0_9BACT|nr:S41 family peptidase [Fibrisoma montanum]RIV20046.1 hypothetical protein DYU11_24355 [Fibrisoma montanum]